MRQKLLHTIVSMAAVMLLAACGSTDLGGILGGGDDSTVYDEAVVRGTVERVDTSNQTIVLRDASTYQTNLRNSGGTNTVYLDYNSNTYVEYGGERYAPSALEVGDRIEANVVESGNRLVADEIRVTYDVSSGTNTGSATMNEMRAIVQSVDTRNREIVVMRDSWSNQNQTYAIDYETNTPVYYQGRTYGPEHLERGDVIDLDLRNYGNTMVATRIDVVESASASANSSYGFDADVRGTVQWVDTNARTLTIERPTWVSRFNTGGNTGNTLTLRYDSSTPVIYNGQTYRPENLERGDTIEIEVNDTGSVLIAEEIMVVSNVRNSSF